MLLQEKEVKVKEENNTEETIQEFQVKNIFSNLFIYSFIYLFLIWFIISFINNSSIHPCIHPINLVFILSSISFLSILDEYEFTKILLLSQTYQRPIGDLSETQRRPTCLIGDPSDTDMPYRRPIRDRHASSETDVPTCLMETHKKYISCLI